MIKSNLRVLLAERDMTIYDLSRETGCNKDILNRLKRNQSSQISMEMLDKLCNFFDCQLGDILRIEETEELEDTNV